jgi:hypothetical protein
MIMKESSLVHGMSVSSTTVDRFLSSPSNSDLILLLRGDAALGNTVWCVLMTRL